MSFHAGSGSIGLTAGMAEAVPANCMAAGARIGQPRRAEKDDGAWDIPKYSAFLDFGSGAVSGARDRYHLQRRCILQQPP